MELGARRRLAEGQRRVLVTGAMKGRCSRREVPCLHVLLSNTSKVV